MFSSIVGLAKRHGKPTAQSAALSLLPQIAAGDLDIAVIGQLPLPQLALDNELETGPLQVVSLDTALRGHGAVDETPEHLSPDTHDTRVFADADAEQRLPEFPFVPILF